MLAADIGNTHSRIAVFAGESIQAHRVFPTAGLTEDVLAPALVELAALAVKKVLYAASVVPAANERFTRAAARAGLALRFIQPGADDIIPHALTSPATTGVDRLLAALAAGRLLFPGRVAIGGGYVVVQCGTAATVDVVDGRGVFMGGYILPGPGLWLRGLADAAQLPDLSADADFSAQTSVAAPGRATRDALLNGMRVALPAAVIAAVRAAMKAAAEGPEGPEGAVPVAVTGGWGRTILPGLGEDGARYRPDLTLQGVRCYAERLAEQ